MLTGQNGILNRAVEAKEKTEIANIEEKRKLAQTEALTNTGRTTYKGITLPEGFAPTRIEGEDSVEDGLVITDGYGNEYVWIDIPRTTEVYKTAGVDVTQFNDSDYSKILKDWKTYNGEYGMGEPNDIYNENEKEENGFFKSKAEYNNAKNEMIKSVYQNGGFWVGRYEAGIDGNKDEARIFPSPEFSTEHDISQAFVVKKNAYPYNWVTRSQAQTLADSVKIKNYMCSLMFGIQWDLMIAFLCKNGQMNNIILLENSTTIGNYQDNLWNITNSSAKYIGTEDTSYKNCPYKKNGNSALLLTTGADSSFSIMNIYDIAGNVWEWTLENTQEKESFEIYRGGSFNNGGIVYRAVCKDHYRMGYKNSANIGFRTTIY